MKWVLITLLILATLGFAESRPRFERLLEQSVEHSDIDAIVIHDRESGAEFVCFFAYNSIRSGCVSTGRSWK